MKQLRDQISITGVWSSTLTAIVLLAFLLLFGACSKDPKDISLSEQESNKLKIRFNLSENETKQEAAIDPPFESQLKSIKVFIFDALTDNVFEKKYEVDLTSADLGTEQPQWASNQTLIIPEYEPSGEKYIYVVANWTPQTDISSCKRGEFLLLLDTITDVSDLQQSPILMSGKEIKQNLNASKTVNVELIRNLAKIKTTVTLLRSTIIDNPDIAWLPEQMTVTVKNVPDRRFIVYNKQMPQNPKRLNSEEFMLIEDPENDQWKQNAIYVNVNTPDANSPDYNAKKSYLIVRLPYKNRSTDSTHTDNFYKIEFPQAVTIEHNTIYDFKIKIAGLGGPETKPEENAENTMDVIPWVPNGMEAEDPMDEFYIDRTYYSFGLEDKVTIWIGLSALSRNAWDLLDENTGRIVCQQGSTGKIRKDTIDGMEYQPQSNTSTNLIITRLKHVAMEKNEHKFKIVVGKRSTVPPYNIPKPALSVPLTVIPNSIPREDVIFKESFKYPNDYQLPEGCIGVQFAKRADYTDPKNPVGDDDLKMCITTGPVYGGTTTNTATGGGESATNKMKDNTGVYLPAAKYCKDMGDGWFIPTRADMLVFHNLQQHLGDSYKFKLVPSPLTDYDGYYWTSSRGSSSSLTFYAFKEGAGKTIDVKDATVRIRCVRHIKKRSDGLTHP